MMKPIKKIPPDRTVEQVRRHYEAEKEIVARLRTATRAERSLMYRTMYDELFAKVPDHPRLRAHLDPEQFERRNLQKFSYVAPYVASTDTFAEFAPGDCAFARFMCSKVHEVYAYDISEQTLTRDPPPNNFHFVVYDGYTLQSIDGKFDVVFSDQFIEHLHPEDVGEHFALVHRALKHGGRYVFRAPHRFLGPHDVSKYFSRTPEGFHLCEPTYSRCLRICRELGFGRVITHGHYRGRYYTLPPTYFWVVEALLGHIPPPVRKFFSRLFLPRQLYCVAVK